MLFGELPFIDRFAAAKAAGFGGVEYLFPQVLHNLPAEAIQIIADVRSSNLFVQYDIYHMQVMEGNIARSLQKHLTRIAHVQLAGQFRT
jgi:hydroxypyruvate isomerase